MKVDMTLWSNIFYKSREVKILSQLSYLFGSLLELIYNVIGDYAISIIVLIVISLILIGDSYNNSFEKAFGEDSKLNKFIKFLNKKL